jgi:broad specificity polyphosphatase/5'/3'-nucleotidase SurE
MEPRGDTRESGSDRFAIDRTPADCTPLGLLHLVPDATLRAHDVAGKFIFAISVL